MKQKEFNSAPSIKVSGELTWWLVIFMKLPQKTSLGHDRGNNLRSCKGTTTPSMLPNIVERPRQKSMTKNRTAQRGETGILMMASVNTMKARPVPSTPWRRSNCKCCAFPQKQQDQQHVRYLLRSGISPCYKSLGPAVQKQLGLLRSVCPEPHRSCFVWRCLLDSWRYLSPLGCCCRREAQPDEWMASCLWHNSLHFRTHSAMQSSKFCVALKPMIE